MVTEENIMDRRITILKTVKFFIMHFIEKKKES